MKLRSEVIRVFQVLQTHLRHVRSFTGSHDRIIAMMSSGRCCWCGRFGGGGMSMRAASAPSNLDKMVCVNDIRLKFDY